MSRPRIERIHHLTIGVPDLERALEVWRDALGVSPDIRDYPEHRTREAAFPVGDIEIRLWQSSAGGPADGVRQIGLQVTRLAEAIEACRGAGLALVAPGVSPQSAGHHRLVDSAGHGPALELVEHSEAVSTLFPRLPASRPAKRPLPAPRSRGAKPHHAQAGARTPKTAKAPRRPVRPGAKTPRRGRK